MVQTSPPTIRLEGCLCKDASVIRLEGQRALSRFFSLQRLTCQRGCWRKILQSGPDKPSRDTLGGLCLPERPRNTPEGSLAGRFTNPQLSQASAADLAATYLPRKSLRRAGLPTAFMNLVRRAFADSVSGFSMSATRRPK